MHAKREKYQFQYKNKQKKPTPPRQTKIKEEMRSQTERQQN